jgi:O-antigen/teichoic acid export membrane protein
MFHLLGIHLLLGLRKFNAYNVLQIFPLLVVITGFAVVAACRGSLAGFLAATSIGWLVGAAVVLAVLGRPAKLLSAVRCDVLLDGCRYALKAHAACLLAFVVQRANVFLLQVNCGEWAVGQYSIAALIGDSLLMLPASVGLVMLPSLVRNVDRRWEITRRNLWHVAPVMLAVCAGVGLLAGPLIPLAFGAEYRPAVGILWRLLPATFFMGLTTVASQYLAALGFPKQLVGVWAVALAIVMILNLQLIPRYAAHGAALSLSITSALTFGMVLALIRWHPREISAALSPGPSWS